MHAHGNVALCDVTSATRAPDLIAETQQPVSLVVFVSAVEVKGQFIFILLHTQHRGVHVPEKTCRDVTKGIKNHSARL